MKKQNNKHNFTWIKCFTLIIAIIVVLLLAVNLVQLFQLNKWKDKIEKIECSTITSEIDVQDASNTNIDLSHFYDALDEKADAAINKVVAVVGILTTVITLFGGLIVFKAPRDLEQKLFELEEQLKEIKNIIEKSKISLAILDSSNKSNPLEKILFLSSFIADYAGKEDLLLDIYFTRGSIYDDIKEYEKARADYIKSHKLGLDDLTFYNAMGVMYNKMLLNENNSLVKRKEFFELSRMNYDNAIKSASNNDNLSDIYCNYACLMGDYHLYDEAFELFNKAKCENPDNYDAFLNEALTYESLKKHNEALDHYTRCIEKNPEYVKARKYRIDLVSKMLVNEPDNMILKTYYNEDYDYLTKESRTLKIIENRRSQADRKSIIDELLSEIEAIENEERNSESTDNDDNKE